MIRSSPAPRDYPFYNDQPAAIGWIDWLVILLSLGIGFAVLTGLPSTRGLGLHPVLEGVSRVLIFSGLPVAALMWRTGPNWPSLFHGWRWSYLGWGILFGIINLCFTYILGSYAAKHLDLTPNAVVGGLREGNTQGGLWLFYCETAIQLFGEELITILPFLFLLWLGVQKMKIGRSGAVAFAWIGSALIFGAIHLPTYGWNLVQALFLIGPVRLVLTLAYMKTKSIWTSTIAHIFNDWSMFTLAILLARAAT